MEEKFNAAVKEANTISKWRDLKVGEIYKIIHYKILETKYGESMKLTVAPLSERSSGRDKITVWCPEMVKETFKTPEDQTAPYTHIRSNGLKPTRSGGKYWSFDVAEIGGDIYQ